MKKIKSKKWKFKKYKLFRRLICFMVVMVSFYCCSYVDAGDYDSLLEKNAMSLVNDYENVIISYLNEITIQSERIKKLDSQNVKEFIEENIKEEGKHE